MSISLYPKLLNKYLGYPIVVEWLCKKFVLPVDTTVEDPEKLKEEMQKIIDFIEGKNARGIGITVNNVGDASFDEDDADNYLKFYLIFLDFLSKIDEKRDSIYENIRLI